MHQCDAPGIFAPSIKRSSITSPTCPNVVAGLVHFALKEFLSYNGIDDQHEDNKHSNVEQWQYGFDNRVQYHLQACNGKKAKKQVSPSRFHYISNHHRTLPYSPIYD